MDYYAELLKTIPDADLLPRLEGLREAFVAAQFRSRVNGPATSQGNIVRNAVERRLRGLRSLAETYRPGVDDVHQRWLAQAAEARTLIDMIEHFAEIARVALLPSLPLRHDEYSWPALPEWPPMPIAPPAPPMPPVRNLGNWLDEQPGAVERLRVVPDAYGKPRLYARGFTADEMDLLGYRELEAINWLNAQFQPVPQPVPMSSRGCPPVPPPPAAKDGAVA